MARLIKPDGTGEVVHPAKGKKFTLEEMQKYVDGYIEAVAVPQKGFAMLVNEHGRLQGLPVNREASSIAGQSIVGNALLLSNKEWD